MDALTPSSAGPGDLRVRRVLAAIFALAGLAALLAWTRALRAPGAAAPELKCLAPALGLLLLSCGALTGQWIREGSRIYDALGATAISAMAWMFGWVTLFGKAENFSGGVSLGGAGYSSSGGATGARIAFGIGTLLMILAAGWAWTLAVRGRRRG